MKNEDSVKLFESIAKKALGANEEQERQLEDLLIASYQSSKRREIDNERSEEDPSSNPPSSSSSSSSSSVVGKRETISPSRKESNQTLVPSTIDGPSLFGGAFTVVMFVCMALSVYKS